MAAPYRIRRASGVQDVSRTGGEGFKEYLDRLMRMIPGEVVGLYLIGSGFIPVGQTLGAVIWTIVCLIGVIIIKAYGSADSEEHLPPDWTLVTISTISFVIWIYTLGGPFAAYNVWYPWIGSLLVLAWTFFVPLFYKGKLDA